MDRRSGVLALTQPPTEANLDAWNRLLQKYQALLDLTSVQRETINLLRLADFDLALLNSPNLALAVQACAMVTTMAPEDYPTPIPRAKIQGYWDAYNLKYDASGPDQRSTYLRPLVIDLTLFLLRQVEDDNRRAGYPKMAGSDSDYQYVDLGAMSEQLLAPHAHRLLSHLQGVGSRQQYSLVEQFPLIVILHSLQTEFYDNLNHSGWSPEPITYILGLDLAPQAQALLDDRLVQMANTIPSSLTIMGLALQQLCKQLSPTRLAHLLDGAMAAPESSEFLVFSQGLWFEELILGLDKTHPETALRLAWHLTTQNGGSNWKGLDSVELAHMLQSHFGPRDVQLNQALDEFIAERVRVEQEEAAQKQALANVQLRHQGQQQSRQAIIDALLQQLR